MSEEIGSVRSGGKQGDRHEPDEYGEAENMSDYILDMRKIVGHRTILQCAASVIIINEEGKLLLGRRTDNHTWCYAGGSTEIDETVEDCAKRELFEEMGLV